MKVYIPMLTFWTAEKDSEHIYNENIMLNYKVFNTYEKAYDYLMKEVTVDTIHRCFEEVTFLKRNYIVSYPTNMKSFIKNGDITTTWGEVLFDWNYVLEVEVE